MHTFTLSGHSLACDEGYDDGYTLSLIWRALAKAFKVTPTEDAVRKALQTKPSPAPHMGTERASGDRTRALVRKQKGVNAQANANKKGSGNNAAAFVGSCTCTCPPGQVRAVNHLHYFCNHISIVFILRCRLKPN